MTTTVGITATACASPSRTQTIDELFAAEGLEPSHETVERLGIETAHVCDGETGSDLALTAVTDALTAAGVVGKELDAIIDYTILPQEYLVPVWNLGNKLQHELDASNAFALGFSGGGTSNFHVALRFATDLIRGDERVRTVLLFGSDVAIAGNRVINPDEPLTVLGDGASAVVLRADAERDVVLGTELVSDGAYHDVYCIPGGALAHLDEPDRPDLYRLRIDTAKLAQAPVAETLRALAAAVLAREGIGLNGVDHVIVPNVSAADQAVYSGAWDVPLSAACGANRAARGHVQATDLVANLAGVIGNGTCPDGGLVLVGSHGMGFTAGVTLLRH